jgi:hypothetical protein
MSQATDRMRVGVVVERREIDNKWVDHAWRPVAIIPGAPPIDEWRRMVEGDGWIQYHAATLDIEIFARETEGYRENLLSAKPAVYVVLRPNVDPDTDREIDVFHVTVCPYEAGKFVDTVDDMMEAVPMPPEVGAWVREFIEKHHVERPFIKRQRLPYDPRKGGLKRGDPPGDENG